MTFNEITGAASTSLEMHVLLGYEENESRVQVQISGLKSNLCLEKKYAEPLGVTSNPSAANSEPKCNIEENHHYTLTNYNVFINRLMPTGSVNLTLTLTGDNDVVACALIRTNFRD